VPNINWHKVIREAMWEFIKRNYYDPEELWLPHGIRNELLVQYADQFRYSPSDDTFLGMKLFRHRGPIRLITRRGKRVYCWDEHKGFMEAYIDDERVALWP
jgi:hypothetical protein